MRLPPTICLHMIVKNDARDICQLLDSVAPFIDYWVICDYGSKDGTPDIIKTYFEEKQIPGELIPMMWTDFGFAYNRNTSYQLSRDKADYILVLDGDMKSVDGVFQIDKQSLNADAYKILNGEGKPSMMEFLFKNELKWHWLGILHEYIVYEDPPVKIEVLPLKMHPVI